MTETETTETETKKLTLDEIESIFFERFFANCPVCSITDEDGNVEINEEGCNQCYGGIQNRDELHGVNPFEEFESELLKHGCVIGAFDFDNGRDFYRVREHFKNFMAALSKMPSVQILELPEDISMYYGCESVPAYAYIVPMDCIAILTAALKK